MDPAAGARAQLLQAAEDLRIPGSLPEPLRPVPLGGKHSLQILPGHRAEPVHLPRGLFPLLLWQPDDPGPVKDSGGELLCGVIAVDGGQKPQGASEPEPVVLPQGQLRALAVRQPVAQADKVRPVVL